MSKHQNRNRNNHKRKKWHQNPRGKTFARYVGITAEIDRTKAKIVIVEAKMANIKSAEDRELYHEMRLRSFFS